MPNSANHIPELLRITPAAPEDLDGLVRLEAQSFSSDAFSRRQLRYLAFQARGLFLVVRQEGRIVGYVSLLWRRGFRNLRVYSIAVDPLLRGQGVGRRLLDAAREYARERGLDLLSLEVHTTNEGALKLYEEYGFRRTALLPDYYGSGEDALRMHCPVG